MVNEGPAKDVHKCCILYFVMYRSYFYQCCTFSVSAEERVHNFVNSPKHVT